MPIQRSCRGVLMALLAAMWGCAHAPPPRAPDPGAVHLPVSCAPAVQAEFDRAVTLLHHMTYVQARQAFRRIATRDPGCAMAQWGIAMTLFQPLWPTRPGPDELRAGWEAV